MSPQASAHCALSAWQSEPDHLSAPSHDSSSQSTAAGDKRSRDAHDCNAPSSQAVLDPPCACGRQGEKNQIGRWHFACSWPMEGPQSFPACVRFQDADVQEAIKVIANQCLADPSLASEAVLRSLLTKITSA
eukprot:6198904-Pleurochrysis_carterae.AAC.2